MSRKHPKNQEHQNGLMQARQNDPHAGEYSIIKYDLIKVLVFNFIYLAAVLVLYYTNRQSHYLENWFSKVLHF